MSRSPAHVFHNMTRRQRAVLLSAAIGLAIAVVAAGVVALGGDDSEQASPPAPSGATSTTTTSVPSGPLTFVVDESLEPSVAEVDPIEGTTARRPVGMYAPAGEDPAELVLGEVIFHADNDPALDAFLARWDGEVVDSFEAEDDGSQDHLVRVDASRADVTALPEDLLAYEDDHAGEHRASSDAVLQLLALAASEWRAGNEVVIDWLSEPTSIESGEAHEAGSKNVFDWSYMQVGGGMNTGVARAWQLLAEQDLLHHTRELVVLDRGFNKNIDFPRNVEKEHGKWGKSNSQKCSTGRSCPWHGTDVIMAALARVDNGYGVAGPAGPVADSVVAVDSGLDYWTSMRRAEKYAKRYHPDALNMSFGRAVNAGRGHARRWTDRRMRHVRDAGALPIAGAGNDGRNVDSDVLVVPCESKHVLCVGGMNGDGSRNPSSAYGGGDSPTSVQIYGPYCVETVNDPGHPDDNATRRACGTSFSAPFVAGVAMLVKAADPSRSPEEVRAILLDTANVGGLGSEVTGSQRRVNALAAVAKVLGLTVGDPVVEIDSPSPGDEYAHTEWVDFDGRGQDFTGRGLELRWESDRDGVIGTSRLGLGTESLSPGKHVISATAVDRDGRTTTEKVTIHVVDSPPEVSIVSPPAGTEVWSGTEILLRGKTVDPDTWSSVKDSAAAWTVKRAGAKVHEGNGHSATIPGAIVSAGTYEVTFAAEGVTDTVTFVAQDPPPGMTPPEATIFQPASGSEFSTSANEATINFAGAGHDAEDGTLPGTRYRWTARSGDAETVLCEGSGVPGSSSSDGPDNDFVIENSCANFEGQLGIAPGDIAYSVWDVQLEVWDSTGLRSSPASISIEVTYVVP